MTGGRVVNDGTATLNTSATLYIYGTTVTSNGTLTMYASSEVYGSGANSVFGNTGTLVVSPGSTGTATLSGYYGGLVVNSTGPIRISSGTLDVYSGATLNLNAGSSVSGSGTLQDQGVLGINSTQALGGPLAVQGTITGAGALTVSGSLTSSGGTFQGPGTVTVASGASWNLPASTSTSVTGGSVVNDGTATLNTSATLYIYGTTVTNNGTLTMYASSEVYGSGANSVFGNTGTLVVSPGSTGTATLSGYYGGLVVNSTGPIQISSGTLDVYSGATLNLNAGSSVSGSGTLQDQGVLGINSTQALAMPLLVQGTITGAGALTVSGSLTSSGGTFQGPGTVTVASGASWNLPASTSTSVTGGRVVNDGTATLNTSATLNIYGTTVTNNGTLTMHSGAGVYGSGTNAVFGNVGNMVVLNTGFTGTATFGGNLVVNSTGPIQISSGTLDVYSGATLNLNAGSSVSGSGTLQDQGVLGINSTQALGGPLAVQGGAVNLAAQATLTVPTLSSPSGTLQLAAANAGQYGQLDVSGSATISSLSLYLNTSYTPVCGTSVTALSAANLTGSWANVSGTSSLPSGATWQAATTATTAGADVYCPPPPAPTIQTYGNGSSFDAVNPSGYFAEPVNTGTGAYSTTETDAKLAGLGVVFGFVRSYTSSDSYSGPLGSGWTDSLNVFAQVSGSTVTVYDENGQQVVFTLQSGGSYVGPAGARSVLSAVSGGGWLLVRHDQTRLTFDASGKLVTETDRNGIGLSLAYNGSGQLASVTDYAGRTVSFSYGGSGLLASMSLPLGRSVSYGYDGSGRLANVTDAAGGITAYTYDGSGRLASITDQNGHQVVANTYDSSGRVIGQVNALGKTATFAYGSGSTTYTDPNGGTWTDVYAGNVLVQRVDPLGGTTGYSYDGNLDQTAVSDANGHVTTMAYDAAGNMVARTLPLGQQTSWTYDAFNDVTSTTESGGKHHDVLL